MCNERFLQQEGATTSLIMELIQLFIRGRSAYPKNGFELMKPRLLLCIPLCAIVVASLGLPAKSGESSQQVVLKVQLVEKAANREKKVLAGLNVATPIGESFSPFQGHSFKLKIGDGWMRFGRGLDGKIERLADGRLHATVKLSVGSDIPLEDDPETNLARTETFDISCVLREGVTKPIPVSSSRYCLLLLEPMARF